MAAFLEEAIERYRRQKFLEDANASYAALKANRKKWEEETAERELWGRACPARSAEAPVSPATLMAVEDRLRILMGL